MTEPAHDSVFTATEIYSWFWFRGEPVNYDPRQLPRSQDAEPVLRETTGLYAIRRSVLQETRCRIGRHPHALLVDWVEGVDVDDQLDFVAAEHSGMPDKATTPVSRSRLLVVGCTRSKDPAQGAMPARRRYTGRVFRALDRFDADGLLADVTVAILYARYGLLAADEPIDWYDQMMTPERARELRPEVTRRIEALSTAGRVDSVFLWLEPVYLAAIDIPQLLRTPGIERRLPPEGTATVQAWLAMTA